MTKGKNPTLPRGRPPLPADAVKRHALGIRTTAALREALLNATRASGRSMAAEIEFRLEQSFHDERRLEQVLELTFGRQAAGLMVALGLAAREAAEKAEATSSSAKLRPWLSNPYVFDQVANAVYEVLDCIEPEGNPAPRLPRGTLAPVRAAAETVGLNAANMACRAIANATADGEGESWWHVTRKWLGNAAAARIKKKLER
jgi:hypothetical protein